MTSIKDDLPELIPVEGKDGLYRDVSSTAIVKDNQDEYDKYMASYNKRPVSYTHLTLPTKA